MPVLPVNILSAYSLFILLRKNLVFMSDNCFNLVSYSVYYLTQGISSKGKEEEVRSGYESRTSVMVAAPEELSNEGKPGLKETKAT